MNQKNKYITYSLLFIFSVFLTKNLFLNTSDLTAISCSEFGHIHTFNQSTLLTKYSTNHSLQSESSELEDCHQSALISANCVLNIKNYQFIVNTSKIIFSLAFKISNNFKSPLIEPFRRPPRATTALIFS